MPLPSGQKYCGRMPRFVWIATNLLGAAASFARAKAGTMASRNGSDRATPAPRRKLRRDRARGTVRNGMVIGSLQALVPLRLRERVEGTSVEVGGRCRSARGTYFVRNNELCTISWINERIP